MDCSMRITGEKVFILNIFYYSQMLKKQYFKKTLVRNDLNIYL